MHHNYLSHPLETLSHNYGTQELQLLKPVLGNKRSYYNEKPMHRNEEQPHSLKLEKAIT